MDREVLLWHGLSRICFNSLTYLAMYVKRCWTLQCNFNGFNCSFLYAIYVIKYTVGFLATMLFEIKLNE